MRGQRGRERANSAVGVVVGPALAGIFALAVTVRLAGVLAQQGSTGWATTTTACTSPPPSDS